MIQRLTILSSLLLSIVSIAGDVPSVLPKTDDKVATDKPVKVYILAGQSNMVGFGKLNGAAPTYPSIYLSADPAIVPCRMPEGPSALLPHGVFQTDAKDAAKGATVSVYKGAYKAGTDYSKMKAEKSATVALGTVAEKLPGIDGDHTIVAKAWIEVPMSGTFELHAGYEDSSNAIATLDGKTVYAKEAGKAAAITKVKLERGKRYPLVITYSKGGSAALWLECVDIPGQGDLTTLIKEGKYTWFMDKDEKWTVRNDVTYWDVRTSKEEIGSGGPLSATSNGKFIGPEVPFGFVMGTFHDEHVLLIESSMGNRALSFDFRPPSSGRTDPDNKYEGFEYRAMVEGVHKALKNIDKVVPNYKGQGYEIVGFVWFQGHKDKGKSKEEYEKHLTNLINDLRKEFKVPDMRAAIASVGFDGDEMVPEYVEILKAQMAVGDPKQHPEFAGKVASVDTRPFWRSRAESPTGTGYHYNHNAETYVLTGDSLGRAMVGLLGGKAEKLSLPAKKEMHPDVAKVYSNSIVNKPTAMSISFYGSTSDNPSAAEYAKMASALRPIILGQMIPEFVDEAFGNGKLRGYSLKSIVSGEAPKRMPESIESQLDTLIAYYKAAGIDDYQWKNFGPDLKTGSWNYYSFDPPEKQPANKSNRYRKITFPEGMDNWHKEDFKPEAASWKQGQAPFGQEDGKLAPRKRHKGECYMDLCGCDKKPNTLWEKEVLLIQQTFDMPAVKDGHAYRLLLGGAGCDRSGEGYAVYINGKLLKQADGGYFRSGGVRGAYLTKEILSEFDGGKVTIAVINFLRYTHHRNQTKYMDTEIKPNGQVSVWIEEAKLPPPVLEALKDKKTEKKK